MQFKPQFYTTCFDNRYLKNKTNSYNFQHWLKKKISAIKQSVFIKNDSKYVCYKKVFVYIV